MRNSLFLAALSVVGLFSGNPAAAQEVFEMTVDSKFVVSEVKWSGGQGKMDFAWAVLSRDGKSWVCGAMSDSNAGLRNANRQVLRKGWVKVDGKKYLTDLSHFNRLGVAKPLIGSTARCRAFAPVFPGKTRFFLGFDPSRFRF